MAIDPHKNKLAVGRSQQNAPMISYGAHCISLSFLFSHCYLVCLFEREMAVSIGAMQKTVDMGKKVRGVNNIRWVIGL